MEFSGQVYVPRRFAQPEDSGFTDCRSLSVNINCLLTENILDFLRYLQGHSVSKLQDFSPLSVAAKRAIPAHPLLTAMRRLTTGILFKKCVFRRFRLRANVIECTFTNLDSTV